MNNKNSKKSKSKATSSNGTPRNLIKKEPTLSTMKDGSVVVKGTELVAIVQHNTNDLAGEVLFQLFCGFDQAPCAALNNLNSCFSSLPNVAGTSALSWVSQFATSFQKFKFRKLGFHTESLASDLASGGYFCGFYDDPLAVGENSVGSLISLEQVYTTLGSLTPVKRSTQVRCPVDSALHLFVDSTATSSQQTQCRFAYGGTFQYVTAGPVSEQLAVAVMMEYEIEFMTRNIGVQQQAASAEVLYIGAPFTLGAPTFEANEGVTVLATASSTGSVSMDPGLSNNGVFAVFGGTANTYALSDSANTQIVASTPSWWNSYDQSFILPGRYLVNTNLLVKENQDSAGGTFGPNKLNVGNTATYSDSLPTSWINVNSTVGTHAYSTGRHALNSSIGASASAVSSDLGTVFSGWYVLVVSNPGDRFSYYLNLAAAAPSGTGSLVLPCGYFITIQRLGGLEPVNLQTLAKIREERDLAISKRWHRYDELASQPHVTKEHGDLLAQVQRIHEELEELYLEHAVQPSWMDEDPVRLRQEYLRIVDSWLDGKADLAELAQLRRDTIRTALLTPGNRNSESTSNVRR